MKRKLTYSDVRILMIILFTIYQLFCLSNLDLVQPQSAVPYTTLTLSVLIGILLLNIILIYMIPLVFVLLYEIRILIQKPIGILLEKKQGYVVELIEQIFITKRRLEVCRC